MKNNKVISNMYYPITYSYPFKGMLYNHLHHDYDKMDRKYHRIIDLIVWFDSDFEEGCILCVQRVSKNGKYEFNKDFKYMI